MNRETTPPVAFETLLNDYTKRMRRGDAPDLERYVRKFPQFEAQIRSLFPTVAALEGAKQQQQREQRPPVIVAAPGLKQLGEYHLLRELGRGGMGIVYLARQESLDRTVALKLLPQQLMSSEKQLARFQREAQTAARMHHTNIVPVFGVGHDAGNHFYVMQYIPGVGLDQVHDFLRHATTTSLRETVADSATACSSASATSSTSNQAVPAAVRGLLSGYFEPNEQPLTEPDSPPRLSPDDPTIVLGGEQVDTVETHIDPPTENGTLPDGSAASQIGPTYWRSVVRLGIQAADGLQYAHNQHVLHRDIKPGNLLVDGQGVLWITDFGLAKAFEGDDVSQTGDVVGTLRYMAPERLRAERWTREVTSIVSA